MLEHGRANRIYFGFFATDVLFLPHSPHGYQSVSQTFENLLKPDGDLLGIYDILFSFEFHLFLLIFSALLVNSKIDQSIVSNLNGFFLFHSGRHL